MLTKGIKMEGKVVASKKGRSLIHIHLCLAQFASLARSVVEDGTSETKHCLINLWSTYRLKRFDFCMKDFKFDPQKSKYILVLFFYSNWTTIKWRGFSEAGAQKQNRIFYREPYRQNLNIVDTLCSCRSNSNAMQCELN